MEFPPDATLAQRFGGILLLLTQSLGGLYLRDRSVLPRVQMMQGRVQSLSRRLQSLLRRIAAGTVRAPRLGAPRRERIPRTEGAATGAVPVPRRFGWLARHDGPAGWPIRSAAWQAGLMLHEAETLETLARAPRQAGRIVRPLCHALGLEVPAFLRLPPRAKRAPTPAPAKAAKGKGPRRPRRVASARWPKGVMGARETVAGETVAGETVAVRSRRRRRGG